MVLERAGYCAAVPRERERADTYFAKALSVAANGGWRRIEAMTLHHLGRSLVERGRLDEAETRIKQALAIREELTNARSPRAKR